MSEAHYPAVFSYLVANLDLLLDTTTGARMEKLSGFPICGQIF